MHKVKTVWKDKMAFDSQIDNHTLRIDANGLMGDDSGPSPKKLLLSALAGCTGMDVVALLKKMRVDITGFEMDIEADLTNEHPKVYSEIRLVYRFWGNDLKKDKIEKAVKLSQDKYCGVSTMLKKNSPIPYSIEYVEEAIKEVV
ncbi:MAG: OsmC family protein [Chitinophagales bacterium]|nr:OsmC family protein [Chitinophagales bacterium]